MSDIVTLSVDWTPAIDPTGHWMSEKFDGVLALWDGSQFITRAGNAINAPEWFKAALPADKLLGEFFMGRGKFNDVLSVVRRMKPRSIDWAKMSYRVFDAPDIRGSFEQRLFACCQTILSTQDIWRGLDGRPAFAPRESPILIVHQTSCESREHFDQFHGSLIAAGAEGSMLRKSMSHYRPGRSGDLLRRKDWLQEEAIVVDHNMNPDGFRSLRCKLISDASIEFDVGSGFSAIQLSALPAPGAIITVKYKSRTHTNSLREPSFVCVRDYE